MLHALTNSIELPVYARVSLRSYLKNRESRIVGMKESGHTKRTRKFLHYKITENLNSLNYRKNTQPLHKCNAELVQWCGAMMKRFAVRTQNAGVVGSNPALVAMEALSVRTEQETT